MKRRLGWSIAVGLVVATFLVVAACAKATPTPTPKPTPTPTPVATPTPTPKPTPTATPTPAEAARYGGVLKVVPQGSISILDPMKGPIITGTVSAHTHESLFALDRNYMPQPQLVDQWQVSPDALTWTFTLRKGLTFQNGEPVNSRAALGSWKRWSEFFAFGQVVAGFINKYEAIDDLTFRFTLKEATGLLPDAFVMFRVLPESQVGVTIAEGLKEVIGCGPYKFKSWSPGDRYVMARWADYKPHPGPSSYHVGRKAAYLDEIHWIEIPDHATRVAALETGEVHFLDEFKSDFAPKVRANPALTLYTIKPGNNLIVVLNNAVPPFKDVRARQAIRMAYPNEDALRAGVGDPERWTLCASFFMCGTRWESQVAADLYNKRDMAGAKKLLQEAGVVGMKVRLMSPEDMPVLPDASLATRQFLQDLGFVVEYQSMDWATLATQRTKPDLWEVFHTWGGRDWSFYSPLSNVAASPMGWWNKYADERGETARLMAKFARAVTFEEQKKVMDEWTRVFWEDVPVVLAGMFYPVMAKRNEVKGYDPAPDPLFFNVWLGK